MAKKSDMMLVTKEAKTDPINFTAIILDSLVVQILTISMEQKMSQKNQRTSMSEI